MKKHSKIVSLALAAVLLFALCACGAGTPASSPSVPVSDTAPTEASAASGGVLDEIKASGELHITLSPDFAPMEFVDSSKDGQEQYVGFDVTLANYIADYIGDEPCRPVKRSSRSKTSANTSATVRSRRSTA